MQWHFLDNKVDDVIHLAEQESDAAGVLGEIKDYRARIHPQEQDELAPMAEKRQWGFASGRYCAQEAQRALGLTPEPILRWERVPIWPSHCVGSITHSKSYACAVTSTSLGGIGVDLEANGRVEEKLYSTLFTQWEQQALTRYEFDAATLIFSAKEAGYKAIYPIGQKFIGFKEAEIEVNANEQTFRIRYLGDHSPNKALETGQGYWRTFGDHVITLFTIPKT